MSAPVSLAKSATFVSLAKSPTFVSLRKAPAPTAEQRLLTAINNLAEAAAATGRQLHLTSLHSADLIDDDGSVESFKIAA